MGQLANHKIGGPKIDTRQWKEVLEYQTYIYTKEIDGLHCNHCGNSFRKGERVTYILTIDGVEHYHENSCLKGSNIISANPT